MFILHFKQFYLSCALYAVNSFIQFPVFFLCTRCKNGYYKLSIQSNYKSTKCAFSMANAFCIILQQIWISVDNTHQLLFYSAWFWCIKLWTFVLRLVWQAVLLTLFCFFLAQTYGAWIRAITLSAVWGWEGFAYRRTDRLSQTVVSASSRGGQDHWVFLLCFSCVCGEAGMLLCFHSWLLLLKG